MKNSGNNNELINLTIRKLTGESSSKDLIRLDELSNQNEENMQLQEELSKTWEGTDKAAGITVEDTNKEWVRLQKVMRESSVSNKSFSFLKIAASVALLIAVGLAIFFTNNADQRSLVAQKVQTEILPDGSSVTLNVNAELKYMEDFSGQKREVSLSGEAFFDVKRDPKKLFIIHTTSMDIKVLGTSFTVRALEAEETSEVVVSTGVVEVDYQGKTIRLELGEKGILNKSSGQLFKIFNNDENFMSWKTKVFTFDDMPLEDVIRILNNAYQGSLYLRGSEIKKCPITVSFENQSLDSIVEVLKATLELSVEKINSRIEISGKGC